MSTIDFYVFSSILIFITLYGAFKNYQNKDLKSYILGNNSVKWSTIGLSVMATQASAITFLSTPGQGYNEGMSFIQIYLGLPLALIVVSAIFVPIYFKSKVFTAYQYLEDRFDFKVRALTSFFFLLQRGLQCGITIYAPSIILTTILGWEMTPTVIFVGLLVIFYTVIGGSKAVSYTHKYQMLVIFSGLLIVFYYLVSYISQYLSLGESYELIKIFDKNNAINFSFDIKEKYTIWSGLLGGFFLSLSYFGTDQSQVSRYINASNIEESRIGLIFNAILKIPLQFFILLLGVLLFVFYNLYQPPLNFNKNLITYQSINNPNLLDDMNDKSNQIFSEKKILITDYKINKENIVEKNIELESIRKSFEKNAIDSGFNYEKPESDFIFLHFILNYLPQGLIGIIIALILSAAMSSTSAEISALSAITTIDIYKRFVNKKDNPSNDVLMSKFFSLGWGIIAILFSLFFAQKENLIESINIVASLLYGNVLGIFLIAFFVKFIKSNNILFASILSQILVFILYFEIGNSISYLWFNFIGTLLTCILSYFLYLIDRLK
ncbi:MAG: sodium:solute symporter [Bacteroidota bacterium]|nr:sodium:solute symporter [Bacteroidota bacterium]